MHRGKLKEAFKENYEDITEYNRECIFSLNLDHCK